MARTQTPESRYYGRGNEVQRTVNLLVVCAAQAKVDGDKNDTSSKWMLLGRASAFMFAAKLVAHDIAAAKETA